MKIEGDYIYFNNGRKLYACLGVIGLGEDRAPTYGFDGGLEESLFDEETLTKAEKIELADYMINLWNKYKTKVKIGNI